MTDQETTVVDELTPNYMIFLLVFFFFLTGLLGFLICHMLKKKGYRCRTGELDDEEEGEGKVETSNEEDRTEENQDTVEQILKCIIENEANMEAFKEMLGTQNTCEHIDSRCVCETGRSKKARRRSRVARFKARPGEQTVFSVGRFRVTHIEKKNSQESSNLPTAESGDLLESLDSETGRQENPKGTYNLQNMFKDVSPDVSNISNGIIPLSELQQPSPQRSSDPVEVKRSPATAEDSSVHPSVSQQAESPSNQEDDTDIPTDPEMSPDKVLPGMGEPGSRVVSTGDVRGSRTGPERTRETSAQPEDGPRSEDGRDDMVEMEDIKDCRVSQSEEAGVPMRDEKRRFRGLDCFNAQRKKIQHLWPHEGPELSSVTEHNRDKTHLQLIHPAPWGASLSHYMVIKETSRLTLYCSANL
ncbi:hypothetical protein GN956_G15100 [Arapaima gigas]